METCCEEIWLTDGSPDIEKNRPFVMTMPDNRYWEIGPCAGYAWKGGKTLKHKQVGQIFRILIALDYRPMVKIFKNVEPGATLGRKGSWELVVKRCFTENLGDSLELCSPRCSMDALAYCWPT